MGIDGGDLNGDGLMDYMVTNFSEETDTLYLGEGGGFFMDGTVRAGLAETTYTVLGFGLGFLDYDLDGDLDIYCARGHILDNVEELHPGTQLRYAQPDQLFQNDGQGHFRDVSATSGPWFQRALVGRAAAFADCDNDGDVDILVVNIGAPAILLQNRLPRTHHWLGLKLTGRAPSNRDAFGARVELKVSGRETPMPMEIRSAASYLAANDARRVVGLGKEAKAEWARIRWPSGRIEVFHELRADAYNLLEEGKGKPPAK
jgi:hypothetical protein